MVVQRGFRQWRRVQHARLQVLTVPCLALTQALRLRALRFVVARTALAHSSNDLFVCFETARLFCRC
jgi:hypothetical protein